eukprot:314044-Pyramimonas_sp.AAC.1
MELTTVVLKAEWMMMHHDWSNVGSAFLGQYAEDSVQDTNYFYRDGLCAPHDVYNNALTTPSYAPKLDRAAVELPARPPGMARAPDTAGHLGHVVEDNLVTENEGVLRSHPDRHIPPQAQHAVDCTRRLWGHRVQPPDGGNAIRSPRRLENLPRRR